MGSIMTLRRARRFDVQQQTVCLSWWKTNINKNGKSSNFTAIHQWNL